MGIGSKLRERRQELNLSRSQLAEKIHVTPSAIANYENGISYPKPDILISLITVLEVDANYFYQDYLSGAKLRTQYGQELTEEELFSVEKYKLLPLPSKRLVLGLINEEYKRVHIDEWAEFPCFSPILHQPYTEFEQTPPSYKIRLKKKHIISGMEYCIQLKTHHCQPVFQSGEILVLQQTPARHNEIGLFRLNDTYYIRTLYDDSAARSLRSLNVTEPDVEIHESDRLICLGKVLGKIYSTYELIRIPKRRA